jgi:tetratricopeptide (TPR) repeat protein
MLCRIFGCAVLSIFICWAQSFAGQSLNNPEANTQSPSITQPRPAEAHISVVRLRVPPKAVELYNHALDAFGKDQLEDARKNVEHALKIYPSYPDALTLRGGIHLGLQRWDAAEQDFRASIAVDPTFSPPYIGLADALNGELHFDEALAVLQQAEQLTPNAWNVQYETSRAFIGKHLYDRALNVIERALRARSAPDSLLRLAKAHALAALGKLPEAAEELRGYLASGSAEREDEQARDLLNQIQAAIGGQ